MFNFGSTTTRNLMISKKKHDLSITDTFLGKKSRENSTNSCWNHRKFTWGGFLCIKHKKCETHTPIFTTRDQTRAFPEQKMCVVKFHIYGYDQFWPRYQNSIWTRSKFDPEKYAILACAQLKNQSSYHKNSCRFVISVVDLVWWHRKKFTKRIRKNWKK